MTAKAITLQGFARSMNVQRKSKEGTNMEFGGVLTLASDSKRLELVESRNDVPIRDDAIKPYGLGREDVADIPLRDDGGNPLDVASQNQEDDVSGLLEEIGNRITETLDMEEEDWKPILERLGISLMDLFLNPDLLKPFVLEVNQATDATEFLTNETMMNQWNELETALLDLMQNEDVPLWEGLSVPDAEPDGTFHMGGMEGIEPESVQTTDSVMEANAPTDGNEALKDVGTLDAEVAQEEVPEDVRKLDIGANQGKDVENSNKDSEEIRILVEKEEGDVRTSNESKNQTGNPMDSQKRDTERDEAIVRTDASNENTTGMLDAFVQNLAGKEMDATAATLDRVTQMREIVTQVVEQIKIMIKPDQTGMEISLNPEHLGKVNLSVVMKEGVATANFLVQNEMVKEALQSQIQSLVEHLEKQGLKVEAVEVNVSEFGFEQSKEFEGSQTNQSKNKKTHRSVVNGLDLGDEGENATDGSPSGNAYPNSSLINFIA